MTGPRLVRAGVDQLAETLRPQDRSAVESLDKLGWHVHSARAGCVVWLQHGAPQAFPPEALPIPRLFVSGRRLANDPLAASPLNSQFCFPPIHGRTTDSEATRRISGGDGRFLQDESKKRSSCTVDVVSI